MAPRGKKEEEKGELLVSVEQFTRTRDQVIVALTNLQTGLTHVQNGLNDLLRAYMTHTTSILSGQGGTIENLQLPSNIAANATAAAEAAQTAGSAIAQAITAPVPSAPAPKAAAAADNKKKRKREKKTRDPNAPKRPLTAAFLYAQNARPVIKTDLERELEPGQKLEPNAVNIEVTKRWNEMTDDEKETWKQSYRVSMEQWKKDSAEYKLSDAAAAFAAEVGEAEHSDEAEGGAADTDVEVEVESEDDEEAVVAKEATPPATKTPRPNKRQKTAQVNGTNHVAIAPASGTSPSKQTPILPPGSNVEAPAPPASTKKDSRKKKAAPQPIAPAPVTQVEATPEDTKKKPKSTRATRNTTEVEIETPVTEKVVKKRDRSKRKSEAATA